MAKFLLISTLLVSVEYSFGFSFRADSTENDVKLKCLPGRRFVYDHNDCVCSNDGTEIICERKMYSTLIPKLLQHQLQKVKQECTPGEHIKEFCHECICDKSGKYANCLRTGCLGDEYGKVEKCLPGTVFSDDCNTCICGADGKGTCTQLDCIELRSEYSNKTLCVPYSDFVFECNECGCGKYGRGLFCNKIGCSNMNFYHENLLNVTVPCRADTTFDYNCHQCQCAKTGGYAMCNGKDCPSREYLIKAIDRVNKCNPGMIFANKCNVCICNKNGKGTCTNLDCDLEYRFKYV